MILQELLSSLSMLFLQILHLLGKVEVVFVVSAYLPFSGNCWKMVIEEGRIHQIRFLLPREMVYYEIGLAENGWDPLRTSKDNTKMWVPQPVSCGISKKVL